MKFLKFSFTIINLSYIKYVDIQNEKYDIYLSDNNLKGSYNYNFLKMGDITSQGSKIIISQRTHPDDYNVMKTWIDSL